MHTIFHTNQHLSKSTLKTQDCKFVEQFIVNFERISQTFQLLALGMYQRRL